VSKGTFRPAPVAAPAEQLPVEEAILPVEVPMTSDTLKTAVAEAAAAPVNTFLTDYAVAADLKAFLDDYQDGINDYTYVKLTDTEATFRRKGDDAELTLPIAHAASALAEVRSHDAMAVKWPGCSNSNYMEIAKRFSKKGYSLPSRVRDGSVIKNEGVIKVSKSKVSKTGNVQDVVGILASLTAARATVATLESNLVAIVASAQENAVVKSAALVAAQADVAALNAAIAAPLSVALKAVFIAAQTAAALQVEALTGEVALAEKNVAALTEAGLIVAPADVEVAVAA
jgi:hypothetical protein